MHWSHDQEDVHKAERVLLSAAALKKKFNIDFTANVQNQRGALAIVHNRVPCRFHLYYCAG
jgi:hypothetical protein